MKLGKKLFPNWRYVVPKQIIFTVKKFPWYRGRYDIIVVLIVHFIIEFRWVRTYMDRHCKRTHAD